MISLSASVRVFLTVLFAGASVFFVVGSACDRDKNTKEDSPKGDENVDCSSMSAGQDCVQVPACVENTKEKSCEARINGSSCRDFSSSAFQCTLFQPTASAKLGCVVRSGVCEAARTCQELTEESLCRRAASENCIYKNGSCVVYTKTPVKPLLSHADPAIQKWFYETFTAFGAYLLYYQTLSKTLGKAQIEAKLNQAFFIGLPGDAAQGAWLGTKKNHEFIGDIDAIDAALVDQQLRTIWESWAQHPANLISWIVYPVAHVKAQDLPDLKARFLDARAHGYMLMWVDDGLCMFSWIMGLTVASCPAALAPRPDPAKWLVEVKSV